ncbi:MAG: DUF4197 domain-containing protein [Burkholderiales bacterium]|nr:DUF4197 domain-containing protein [Burkholderiales bacterium]
MIGEAEKNIRKNPLGTGSDILKKSLVLAAKTSCAP